ncbi:hypothetical protein [Paraburkholderia caffeinilytica]|uniref:hypothetical protein n=1 Tax=Paraburkholderia caffeinilytica TaxID=1761016 RepID=UPI003DA08501
MNSLSDEPWFYLQNQPRLAVGRTCLYQTQRRPLFFIPRAAILRGGALSGTFHPNARRHEDMTITADFSHRGHDGRQIPVSRDALSLSPFRLPEREPDVALRPPRRFPSGRIAWRASIPSPGFSAGTGASMCK